MPQDKEYAFIDMLSDRMREMQGFINRYGSTPEQIDFIELQGQVAYLGREYLRVRDNAEEIARNLATAERENAQLRRELKRAQVARGMDENSFRYFLDELTILVEQRDEFDPLQVRDLVALTRTVFPEEPYHSWCEQWRKGDYPTYLMNLRAVDKDIDSDDGSNP